MTQADGYDGQSTTSARDEQALEHGSKASQASGRTGQASRRSRRCRHPTQRGGLCRRPPMAGSERCHHHVGLEPTEAERRASRENPVKHGYFVAGFLDEDEREIFRAVLEGEIEPSEIQRQVIGALVVQAVRMMRWEAKGEEVSGLATSVFAELRKSLDALDPEALTIEHTWDDAEIHQAVTKLLREDREILLGVVPPEVHDEVEAALDRAGR